MWYAPPSQRSTHFAVKQDGNWSLDGQVRLLFGLDFYNNGKHFNIVWTFIWLLNVLSLHSETRSAIRNHELAAAAKFLQRWVRPAQPLHYAPSTHLWKFHPAQPRPTLSNWRYFWMTFGNKSSEKFFWDSMRLTRYFSFLSGYLHRFCFRPILMLQRHSAIATDSKLSQFRVISINRMRVERFIK